MVSDASFIKSKQMDSHLPLGERPKGFRPGDGLGFNRSRPATQTELALVYLDVRKAFDNVKNQALLGVCIEYGVLCKILNYLRRVYAESITRLKNDCNFSSETITSRLRHIPHI